MPRPPIDPFWLDRIRTLSENYPRGSVAWIEGRLRAQAQKLGRDDAPSQRSIQRYRREHLTGDETARQNYRWVYWPESFERGELPWEASPEIIELLRATLEESDNRPPLRFARWFLRVTQVAPTLPLLVRRKLARSLYAAEVGWAKDEEATRRSVEQVILGRAEHLEPQELVVGVGSADDLRDFVEILAASEHRSSRRTSEHHSPSAGEDDGEARDGE